MNESVRPQSLVAVGEVADRRPARQYQPVENAISLLDTAAFEHLQRVATMMAAASLIPECLRGEASGFGQNRVFKPFPPATVLSNCFMIAEQAVRWNMSPFAVAQSCSVVRGKLMYEGKLVAAVIEARVGVKLSFTFGLWNPKTETVDTSKEGEGDLLGVVVGVLGDPTDDRIVEGSVGAWKTEGSDSAWGRAGAKKRMLRYRGSREWCRAHEPGVMLGVITEDEIDDMFERRFAREAAPRMTSGFDATAPLERLGAPVAALAARPADDNGQLDEASHAQAGTDGGHDPVTGELPPEKAPPKPPRAARNAEPPKTTSDSATPASPASPDRTDSSPRPPEDPTSAGATQPDDMFPGDRLDEEDAPANVMVDAIAGLETRDSWDGIVAILRALAVTPDWKASGDASKRLIRQTAWARFAELHASGQETTDVAAHFALFRFWLEFGAASAGEIDAKWPAFWRSAVYRQASEADKKAIQTLFGERKTALAASKGG